MKHAKTDAKESSDCQWPRPDRVNYESSFILKRVVFGKREKQLLIGRAPFERLYGISPNGELSPLCPAKSTFSEHRERRTVC